MCKTMGEKGRIEELENRAKYLNLDMIGSAICLKVGVKWNVLASFLQVDEVLLSL